VANEKRLSRPAARIPTRQGLFLLTVGVWLAVLLAGIGEAHGEEAGARLAREAREAAGRDEHGEAVAAALAALERNPSLEPDLALLLGYQLTWQERSEEAIPWFRRHLEHHPGDREGRHALARALSWSGERREALGIYRGLRDEDPSDLDAQLGVARMAAWADRPADAAREYARALELEPSSREAALGLARAENLRGRHRRAEALLAPLAEAGHAEAGVELARARWWMGEPAAALDRLDGDDTPGAHELGSAIRRDERVRASVFWEHWIDVDDQELETTGASAQRAWSRGLSLFGEVARETVDEPDIDEVAALRATAGAGWRFDRRVALNGRLTVEDVGRSLDRSQVLDVGDGETVTGEEARTTQVLWDTWATWTPRDWTRLDAGVARLAVQTPRSRARGIVVDQVSLSAERRLSDRWIARAAVSHGSYSDDNTRVGVSGEVESGPYAPTPALALFGAVGASRIDFDESPDHGYYSPSSYDGLQVGARATLRLGPTVTVEGDLRVTAEREGDGDRFGVANGGGTLRWSPPGAFSFGVFARNSTSRFDTDAGYGRRGLGAFVTLAP